MKPTSRKITVLIRFSCSILYVSLVMLFTLACAAPVDGAIHWPTAAGGNGHWYEAVVAASDISWTDAKAAAEASLLDGVAGHLVTITSSAENNFVYSLIAGNPTMWHFVPRFSLNGPWLGLYQDTSDPAYSEPAGAWKWVTGEPLVYTNWRAGSPNDSVANPGNDNYGRFIGTVPTTTMPSTPSPFWDDHPLLTPPGTRSYIIEWEAVPELTSITTWAVLFGVALGSVRRFGRRG